MTISPWTIYWITRLDNLAIFFSVVCALAALFSFVCLLAFALEDTKSGLRYLRFSIPIVCLSGFCAALLPSSKEAAAMILVPKIVNNEKVAMIPSKVLDLADEWLESLKPPKN